MTTEQRKLVSVVFADVVGSTAFGSDNDPEAVRSVMGSYFERMKTIAETHGGTVEKFIGDAVMVVFGVPRLHDDDAERAVRAALAMRDAMRDLNRELGVQLAARVGVNTGEAVAGSGTDRQFLVTGDAVNVAARLQQGADAGEVIAGALTESLTRSAIEYEPRESVAAKGKPEPVRAFRAIRPRSAVPEQARGLPAMRAQLVGRQRELRLLLDTFERVRTERRAHLFTLVGNAGIGKSRLVGELLARIASGGDARVLRGRCLPYGQGITYWPLMEIVRQDAGIASDDDRDTALAKLDRRTAELGLADGTAVVHRLSVMLGLRGADEALSEVGPEGVAREIAWAFREYVATVARSPLAVVIDDLQWAEPSVLEIVASLVERAEDAPLLLLCVARPTLLETHADWGGGRANMATITLDALDHDETKTLISRLLDVDDLPADLRERVVERSEGNPLFVEEFLRMLIDEGRVVRVEDRWQAGAGLSDVRVPESIHALLAARIDSLADDERRTLQIASIVGERFGESEVRALTQGVDVARAIAGLRRAGLVLEDHETRARGSYRFKHLLMRDVAYAGMSKATRADLHEAFARELERSVGDRRDEYAEIVAHHEERAFTLAAEVRAPQPLVARRARAVLERSLALGERARRREDAVLLTRAAGSVTAALEALHDDVSDEQRVEATLLRAAERRSAAVFAESLALFDDAASTARRIGRPDLEARAHLGAADVLAWSAEDAGQFSAFATHAAEAARLFREAGDAGGEIEAGLVALNTQWASGELDDALEKSVILAARAREIGDQARELRVCAVVAAAATTNGHREIGDEYVDRADRLVALLHAREPRWLRYGRCARPWLDGDLDAALRCYAALETLSRTDLDSSLAMAHYRGSAEILVLDRRAYAEARPLVEQGLALSVRTGERWDRAELTGTGAVVAAGLGDLARAERMVGDAYALADRGDVFANAYITYCNARIHEIAGEDADAERVYREAADMFAGSGFTHTHIHGLLLLDIAAFLLARGRTDEAAEFFARAEANLKKQIGERAERIATLKERIAVAKAAG